MNLYFVGFSVLILIGSHAAVYRAGDRSGAQTERALCADRERVRDDAIDAEKTAQSVAVDKLNVEIEHLRKRAPEIRTITKQVVVNADAECASLPASWGQLWNAGSVPVGTADSHQSAASDAAAVRDGSVPVVADPSR